MGNTLEERAEARARVREEKARRKAEKKRVPPGFSSDAVKTPEQELLTALEDDRHADSKGHGRFRSIEVHSSCSRFWIFGTILLF